MYTSEVQIVNSALIKLGVETISTLNETSKEAKLARKQYPIVRDEVLYSHPWNFAAVRTELGQSVVTPSFGYTYQYVLPSDVLRILNVNENDDGEVDYVIEHEVSTGNRVLRTDESSIKILYTRRLTDVTQFTPGFGETISMRLAADLAMPLVESRTTAEFWFKQYELFAARSRSYDAQEGSTRQVITSRWKNARR